MPRRAVRPLFWPPSLVVKQIGSALYYGWLVGWGTLPQWLYHSGPKMLPVAAGAQGMGCIGFPAHPVWEITLACNLRCIHCHASSGKPHPQELSTEEGLRLLEELAAVRDFRLLVLTGGEPLLRHDLLSILAHAQGLGFGTVIATNATLLTEEMALSLRERGVVGLAISLDAAEPQTHNLIRNSPKAFERAMLGIRNAKEAGLALQINITAMSYNLSQMGALISLVDELGADILLVYQLVPMGRGNDVAEAALKREDNEKLLTLLAEKQRKTRTVIEPVAAPQYWPYLLQRKGLTNGPARQIAQLLFHGCTAGRGLVYIKANGEVWPCPFVPISAGNIRQRSFAAIWQGSPIFRDLRRRDALKGRCGPCPFNNICGGCRGRAHAYSGDYLAEDPSCFIAPSMGEAKTF